MLTLFVISILVVIAIIGFTKVLAIRSSISKRLDNTNTYLKRLQDYVASNGQDNISYTWLIEKSTQMQFELGSQGIIDYKPPAAMYYITNYPVIVNLLPELRRALNERHLFDDSLPRDYSIMIQEVLIRHIGVLKDNHEESNHWITNPFVWLREGVKSILLFPFNLLQWVGLASPSFTATLSSNPLMRTFSGLVVLVGLIASIVTITIGWSEFISLWHKLF